MGVHPRRCRQPSLPLPSILRCRCGLRLKPVGQFAQGRRLRRTQPPGVSVQFPRRPRGSKGGQRVRIR